MFGIIADLIASVTTILLPAYLSYKSLRSGDPAQTTPWLIYFIMLSLSLVFESWTVFILGWVPFYSWIRLFYLLYLVLPQTQGAKYLYLEYVEPYIVGHETRIDKFIGEAHYKLESLGLGYLAFVVDFLREKILGQSSPSPPSAQSSQGRTSAPGYGAAAVSSYASDLLSRFAMPAARSQATQSAGAAPPGTSLASFLTSALASASNPTTQTSYPTASRSTPSSDSHGHFAGLAVPDLSSMQSYLSNPSTSNTQKSDLIQTQRDRLNNMLRALDKEQQTLDLAYGSTGRPTSRGPSGSLGMGQKSRSEQSFENVSYEDVAGGAGGDHTPTMGSSPPNRGSAERHGSAKRTTSGGWASGWFGGSSPSAGGSGGKEIDGREGEDLVSRGWSAAREMTEEVLRERGAR